MAINDQQSSWVCFEVIGDPAGEGDIGGISPSRRVQVGVYHIFCMEYTADILGEKIFVGVRSSLYMFQAADVYEMLEPLLIMKDNRKLRNRDMGTSQFCIFTGDGH
jgi:hypothetical protein